jgi:CBS domain-containing protein
MQIQGKAQQVSIYIGESNHFHGKSLYMAILEFLRQEGASGATVLRGLAGFGAHSRIHTTTILDLSADLPIVVVWVDLPERVERLLPVLRKMVNDGLITVEEIQVVQYAAGRRPNPLEQPVRDVMREEVVTVMPDTPVAEIVQLLLQRGYRSLPVIDAEKRLVGIITDGDLLQRTGIEARLGLQADLSPTKLLQQLAVLQQQSHTARDIMTRPVIAVHMDESVRVAAERMAEHRLKRLPVVDPAGRLVGLVSRLDIFRAVEYHQSGNGNETEDAPHEGFSVSDLMYKDVPTVRPQARLEEILQALEVDRRRRAIVIDDERHVLGIITDGDLLRRSRHAEEPGLVGRLRALVGAQKVATTLLPRSNETAAALMTTPVLTIRMDATLQEALRLMLQHHIKRLPVVDSEGRLMGLLGRASVLQGLLASQPPAA